MKRLKNRGLAILLGIAALGVGLGTMEAHADTTPGDQPAGTLISSTRTTETYSNGDGSVTTAAHTESIYYRSPEGQLVPIDNSLEPIPGPDTGVANAANRYSVDLPADISDPVQVSRPSGSVGMTLLGATATRTVDGNQATYENALPGVTATYEAQADGLKESLTLANSSTESSFDFRLSLSDGLLVRQANDGGIEIVKPDGGAAFMLTPPFATDSSGNPLTNLGEASMTLSSDDQGYIVTESVDPSWLSSPERVWPVVIDPTVTIPGATLDCWYQSGTSGVQHSCTTAGLNVGYNQNGIRRAVLKFALGSVPTGSVVTGATLDLTLTADNNTNLEAIEADQVTNAFDSNVSWTAATGSQAWTSAGGDVNAPISSLGQLGGTITSPTHQSIDVTQLVQGWQSGAFPNNGLLLRQSCDTTCVTAGNILTFASTENTDSTERPVLTITYDTPPNDTSAAVTVLDNTGAPVSGADVHVWYEPEDPDVDGTSDQTTSLQDIGRGTTDATGNIVVSLDTSAIPVSELGTLDNSDAAFNTMVTASSASGTSFGVDSLIAVEGTTQNVVQVTETPGWTTETPSQAAADAGTGVGCTSSLTGTCSYSTRAKNPTKVRYVPVAAMNNSPGMNGTFTLGEGTDHVRETQLTWASGETAAGTFESSGKFSLERGRTQTNYWNELGTTTHAWVWQQYRYNRHFHIVCEFVVCQSWYTWDPAGMTGTNLVKNNPDTNSSGVTIGVKSYIQHVLPTASTSKFMLTANTTPYDRAKNQVRVNSFEINVNGWLDMSDKASYVKNTNIHYDYTSGCSGTRWIYGTTTDLIDSPVIETTCV